MSDRFAGRARQLACAASKVLGWTPETFWTATPSDLANALGVEGESAAMDRATLDALCDAMPDEGK